MGNEINATTFFKAIEKEIKEDNNINKEVREKDFDLKKYFENCSDTKIIIPILQKVNEYFIKNCEIHIGKDVIIPTETEIYFKNNFFYDGMCHTNSLQTNRFGMLYFHRYYSEKSEYKDYAVDNVICSSPEKTRGGIDVCISNGNYYLSILIRGINKPKCKGPNLVCREILGKENNYISRVGDLEKKFVIHESIENKNKEINFDKRVGGKRNFYKLNCKIKNY